MIIGESWGKCYLYEYVSSFLRASTDVKHNPSVSHVPCSQLSQWHFNRPVIQMRIIETINLFLLNLAGMKSRIDKWEWQNRESVDKRIKCEAQLMFTWYARHFIVISLSWLENHFRTVSWLLKDLLLLIRFCYFLVYSQIHTQNNADSIDAA